MKITEKLITELAPSVESAKNGRDLMQRSKFSNLKISADETIIWGECAGSGKNPYSCSADFNEELHPIFRCNCPSRQLPCKHALGLLYASQMGMPFQTADIPEDIVAKREKLEKRQEKKTQEKETIKEKVEKAPKINASTLIKKIDAQLTGIGIAEKLLKDLVQNGLSSIDARLLQNIQSQIKELGNYYVNGIQTAFNNLMIELSVVEKAEYTAVIDQINYISALLKKSTEYLQQRKQNPEENPELHSAIEEQIGYVWKLTDLMQYGLWEENAEIMQLSFISYDNPARKEWVDEGIWINLKTGKIHKTHTYRPYKAIGYIKEENSDFGLLKLKEIFIYPGDQNPRIRWEPEALIERTDDKSNFDKLISFAHTNYAETIKSVKNTIKNPLMDKNPVVLLALHNVFLNGNSLVIEDREGYKITLKDMDGSDFSPTAQLKTFLPAHPGKVALAVMINNNVQTGLLSAQPLSLVTSEKMIRLLF